MKKKIILKSYHNDGDQSHMKKVRVKRYIFKVFKQQETMGSRPKRIFPDQGQLKYLSKMSLESLGDIKGPSVLRSLSRLNTFVVYPFALFQNEKRIFPYLKALPKSTKTLALGLGEEVLPMRWSSLAQILSLVSRSPNLRSVFLAEGHGSQKNPVYSSMKRYFKRNSHLNRVGYKESSIGLSEYVQLLEKREEYTEMKDLCFTIDGNSLALPNSFSWYVGSEISDDESDIYDADFWKDGWKSERLRTNSPPVYEEVLDFTNKRIKPLFNFNIFPNLRSLALKFDLTIPLDNLWKSAFQSLKNLDDFSFKVGHRPPGISHFFRALVDLHELRSFEIDFPFLRGKEWSLLTDFVSGQRELKMFGLTIFRPRLSLDRYDSQNHSLRGLVTQCGHIETLNLQCPFSCLQEISHGFSSYKLVNKLTHLKLQASCFEESVMLNGLFDVLVANKKSLKSLELVIPFVLDMMTIESIFQTISKLEEVRSLRLELNGNPSLPLDRLYGRGYLTYLFHHYRNLNRGRQIDDNALAYDGFAYTYGTSQFLTNILKKLNLEEVQRRYQEYSEWWTLIGSLREMTNLEELRFAMGQMLELDQAESYEWFLNLLELLPTFKFLRVFEFQTPFDQLDVANQERMQRNIDRLKANPFLMVNQRGKNTVVEFLNRYQRMN